MPKKYAKALLELLSEKDVTQVAKNFADYLKAKGKLKLWSKILFELEKELELENKRKVKVQIGSEKYKEKGLEKAKSLGFENPQVEVKKELIGSYRIISRDFIYDASYKKKVLDLYEKLKDA